MTTAMSGTNLIMLDEAKIGRQLETARLFVLAVVGCSLITVVAIIVLSIVMPNAGSPVSIIVGIMTPVITTLLAASIHQNTKGVDGRMSQLLKSTTAQAELQSQADTLKSLGYKLQSLEPGTAEYNTIAEQLQTLSLRFAGVERRIIPGGASDHR